jgi:prepilin-type N-terminal cleavage/methylation domain-containing protein
MFFKTPNPPLGGNHKWSNYWKLRLASRAGFTLLEIIVVFSVMAIVATVGVAAFVNYSKTHLFRHLILI